MLVRIPIVSLDKSGLPISRTMASASPNGGRWSTPSSSSNRARWLAVRRGKAVPPVSRIRVRDSPWVA